MRCTRCDRIAVPQAVGRSPEGLVVFGWCLNCLAEGDCVLVEIPGKSLRSAARSARRAAKRPETGLQRPAAPRPEASSRRLAISGVAGLMGVWAIILLAWGGLVLPGQGSREALAQAWGRVLLIGGGLMALTSLAVWALTLDRLNWRRIALKAAQAGGAALAFSVLAWGAVHHDVARDIWVVAVAALGLGLSWVAHRHESLETLSRTGQAPQALPGVSDTGSLLVNLEDDSPFEGL
jgi:hypothetical protein